MISGHITAFVDSGMDVEATVHRSSVTGEDRLTVSASDNRESTTAFSLHGDPGLVIGHLTDLLHKALVALEAHTGQPQPWPAEPPLCWDCFAEAGAELQRAMGEPA